MVQVYPKKKWRGRERQLGAEKTRNAVLAQVLVFSRRDKILKKQDGYGTAYNNMGHNKTQASGQNEGELVNVAFAYEVRWE